MRTLLLNRGSLLERPCGLDHHGALGACYGGPLLVVSIIGVFGVVDRHQDELPARLDAELPLQAVQLPDDGLRQLRDERRVLGHRVGVRRRHLEEPPLRVAPAD